MKKMLMILHDDESTFKELFQFLKEKNRSEMGNDSSTTNGILDLEKISS